MLALSMQTSSQPENPYATCPLLQTIQWLFACLQNTINGIQYKNDPTIFAWDLMNEGGVLIF